MKPSCSFPEKPEAVYYFGTCLADLLYAEAGMAGIRLLQREGIRVIYPRGQSCCGQPAYNSGFQDDAREVAALQIVQFPKNLPIVIPSGSCGAMMTRHYEELFEGHPLQEKARSFSARIFELSEFLVNVLKVKLEDRGDPVKVTWHSSCHAKREFGLGDEAKQLLRQLKNVELVELERENECCGFGGTFSVKFPAISGVMAQDKSTDVMQTGADFLLSTDCGCLMNINGTLEKQQSRIQVEHFASFLWNRTHAG
ncbi:MAG: (Fe-S)-binding protein [SAR324 cluster bacterium]|jgi:L-lactate dehydrogenase complex protein LldE|nr:(Fe-S)-binding protein [SAR324 cluster bacterium]